LWTDFAAPRPGDIVLDKTRPSFFAYTELEPLLRNFGVSRLIVAGLPAGLRPVLVVGLGSGR